MFYKYLICMCLIASVFVINKTNAEDLNKSLLDILEDLAKKAIEKLVSLVEDAVNKAVEEIQQIEKKIGEITEYAIKLALGAINGVIDGAIDAVRKIAQDAIDAGINITECYVQSVDTLNIIRRQLLTDEVICATSQLDAFNEILNSTVKNFTDDLNLVGDLPKRLAGCLTDINVIQCVTKLITDVTNLQQEIPKQIIGTMTEISEYFTMFDKRVHQCQFDELRQAVNESRKVIDDMKFCAREAENSTEVTLS